MRGDEGRLQGSETQNNMGNCILAQLSSDGFKGKTLRDLGVLIKNDMDYKSFQEFILVNCEKISLKSHYLYAYRLQVIRLSPLIREHGFIEEFTRGTEEEKRVIIQDLAKEYVSINELQIIEKHLLNKTTTLKELYSLIIEKRTKYSIRTVINLLSI